MSKDSLQRAVESAIAQFKDDVTANRNLLLSEMKMALSTADAPLDFPKPQFSAFQKLFDHFVARSVTNQANQSLINGVVAVVASSAGGLLPNNW